MSYKALYRKYRPQNFNDVVGQDHIISTLKNIIESSKISHAYLFAGPRGTGKTSIAHIFAKNINKTASGTFIEDSLDIIEIDAASNNGVAEIRNLIDNSQYAPNKSKYKVYIIDEVHMLTKGAFNALLKTLEEPSKHLVFILATTEPHRIPITILSRAQRFNFHRIKESIIFTQLKNVLEQEEIFFEEDAIKYIAKLAQGGMRDAFSIADQAASYGKSNITFAAISQVFGIISIENQIKLLNLAFANKTKDLLSIANQFIDNGVDIERLTSSLIDICKEFIIHKKTDDESLLNTLSDDNFKEINFNLDFAYEVMEILVKIISELKYSEMPRQIFELSLLKLIEINKENIHDINQKNVSIQEEKKIENDKKEASNDIFKTQEIAKNTSNEVKTDEIDLQIDKVNENLQDLSQTQEIENDILSTQEMQLNNEENIAKDNSPKQEYDQEHNQESLIDENKDVIVEQNIEDKNIESISQDNMKKQENTEEINLDSYFVNKDDSNNLPSDPKNVIINLSDILNLLVQANKEKSHKLKDTLKNILEKINHVDTKEYISLIKDLGFISGGDNFILLASSNNEIVNHINNERDNQKFIDFTNQVFDTPLHVFAITKEQFIEVKKMWEELSKTNSLPEPKLLPEIKASEIPKSDAEKLGEELFGELFG